MRFIYWLVAVALLSIGGCQQSPDSSTQSASQSASMSDEPCPAAIMSRVQHYISAQDGQGHGPDPGSAEWFSSIEHKLSRQSVSSFPPAGSLLWCDRVLSALNVQPAFACRDNMSAAEAAVCDSASLAALDVWLEDTYMNALQHAEKGQVNTLKAMQRGWLKGRDECWKETDIKQCVRNRYVERISELQAHYVLVAPVNSARLICPDGNRHTLQFFATPMSAMTIHHNDGKLLLWQVMAASGTRYEGANTLYWEHQGEVQFISGVGAEAQTCTVKSSGDE